MALFFNCRDSVVQKWFERTRGFVKQNKTAMIDQSPIVQIKEVPFNGELITHYSSMFV